MEESLYCKICFKKCSGVSELKLHVESRHQKRLRTDNAELPNESSKKSDDADEVPVKPVEKKDGWVPLSTKPFKKNKKEPESFIDHNRIEREYVECNVCQEICADESALRKHCEQHLLQNQTTCGVCAKIFRNVYALNEHFKSHKSSLYACYICDEQYRTKEGLSRHVCANSYPCNVCSKVFRSKDELLKHFFVHKGLQAGTDVDAKFH